MIPWLLAWDVAYVAVKNSSGMRVLDTLASISFSEYKNHAVPELAVTDHSVAQRLTEVEEGGAQASHFAIHACVSVRA